jgi:hypothetical protein
MADQAKIAKVLKGFVEAMRAHDAANPSHHAWGIGMAQFDIERLGLEDGEEIIPGIVIQADGGNTGQFRVLCDGDHDEELEEEEEEVVDAYSEQELLTPVFTTGPSVPPPLKPPV